MGTDDKALAELAQKWRQEWRDATADQLPDLSHLKAAAELDALRARQSQGEALPDECAASGQGHRFGPHGPDGERQCAYCGEQPEAVPDAVAVELAERALVAFNEVLSKDLCVPHTLAYTLAMATALQAALSRLAPAAVDRVFKAAERMVNAVGGGARCEARAALRVALAAAQQEMRVEND